eukprot:12430874-Karenia_brevis.AAC.1
MGNLVHPNFEAYPIFLGRCTFIFWLVRLHSYDDDHGDDNDDDDDDDAGDDAHADDDDGDA